MAGALDPYQALGLPSDAATDVDDVHRAFDAQVRHAQRALRLLARGGAGAIPGGDAPTLELHLTASELAAGAERTVELPVVTECFVCRGRGSSEECADCSGAGFLADRGEAAAAPRLTICETCAGTGQAGETCACCGGAGSLLVAGERAVVVPAGVDDGAVVATDGASVLVREVAQRTHDRLIRVVSAAGFVIAVVFLILVLLGN